MWANCSHGHFYRNIEPNVSLQILKFEEKKSRQTSPRQICTNEYLAMMGIVDSDICPECCNAVETV